MKKEEDVSDEFLGELRDVVEDLENNSPKNDGSHLAELDMEIPRNAHEDREMTGVPGFGSSELDTDSVTLLAAPAANHPEDLMNLDELCADVMKMHKDEDFMHVQERRNVNTKYEFAWTGM